MTVIQVLEVETKKMEKRIFQRVKKCMFVYKVYCVLKIMRVIFTALTDPILDIDMDLLI